MSGMNKAIVIGNLGHDPEVKTTDSGRSVCNFRVATTDRWRDKEGSLQERTEWHRVVAWGKTAELVGQFMKKGRRVGVEGRLQTRKWKDKEDSERTSTEIVADRVMFLDSRKQEAEAAAA